MSRIILADNQAIFRIGAAEVLAAENHAWMVVQYPNWSQLYAAIAASRGALVIVSCSLQPTFPLLFVRATASSSKVLAVAENGEPPSQTVVTELRGLIYRNTSAHSMIDCVRRVLQGEIVIHPVQQEMNMDSLDFAGARVRDSLVPTEINVIGLIVEGYKNRQIGLRLGITEQTIKNSLFSIYNKVGVCDRVQLALFTLSHPVLARAASDAGKAISQHLRNA